MCLIESLILFEQKEKHIYSVKIDQCYQVQDELRKILNDNPLQFKKIYLTLQQIISTQSKQKGPKSFEKLLKQVFYFIKQYSFDRISSYNEEVVICNLTYYKKSFDLYLKKEQKMEIGLIQAITALHSFLRRKDNSILLIEQKVKQIINEIGSFEKEPMLHLVFGVMKFLQGQYKKSKILLTKLFNKQIGNFQEIVRGRRNLGLFTDINKKVKMDKQKEELLDLLIVCSYYNCLLFKAVENYELCNYYSRKAYQLAVKKENNEEIIAKIKELNILHFFRMKSDHKSTLPPLNENKLKAREGFLIGQKKNEEIENELTNIFTIKDTKGTMFKLRKENLRYLNREQRKIQAKIKAKHLQINQIREKLSEIQRHEEIRIEQNKIQSIYVEKDKVLSEYIRLKEQHWRKLKQIDTISQYIHSFFSVSHHQRMVKVYDFLYGQIISRTKIKILSFWVRRAIRKSKKLLKCQRIKVEGVECLVQFFQVFECSRRITELFLFKQKNEGFYIKLYAIQNNKEKKVMECEKRLDIALDSNKKERIARSKFCYQFEYMNGKVYTWEEYLSTKSILALYYIKKFIQILTKKETISQESIEYRKYCIDLKYSQYVRISTFLFCMIVQRSESSAAKQIQLIDSDLVTAKAAKTDHGKSYYTVKVFSIGGPKYQNKLYNIKIDRQIVLHNKEYGYLQSLLEKFLKQQISIAYSNHIKQVKKLQSFMRVSYCKKSLKKLKQKNKTFVFVDGAFVITYCKFFQGRHFICVENIITKERELNDTIFQLSSFIQIKTVQQKLAKQKNCKDKLKLICKFVWTKFFITQLRSQFKKNLVMTQFQVGFKNRLIFAKLFPNFIYKRKLMNLSIMFSLSVESLIEFPRPYILRVFTISKGPIKIDANCKIFNKEKIYYEKFVQNLNKIINISSANQVELIGEDQVIWNQGKRSSRNSRSSSKCSKAMNKFPSSFGTFQSQIDVRSDFSEAKIIPKQISKKTSMLQRFKNRKSSELCLVLNNLNHQNREETSLYTVESNAKTDPI